MKKIVAQKIGMTQIFDKNGKAQPVTVVSVPEMIVVRVKNEKKDGYNALVVGVVARKKSNKPQRDYLAKHKLSESISKFFEVKTDHVPEQKVGDIINIDEIAPDQAVKVSGVSIGKGFAGTIKKHHFHRGPVTHGSHNIRQPGSIGATGPQRVPKGKKMAGRLGAKLATIINLKVLENDIEKKLLIIKGAVPGKAGNWLSIRYKKN